MSRLELCKSWLDKPAQQGEGFTFLNLRKDFPGGIDWRCPEMPGLWRYNLHSFDYLLGDSRPVEERCRPITRPTTKMQPPFSYLF